MLDGVENPWHDRWMGTVLNVTGLDHIVLVCADVERTLTWYCDLLGLEAERAEEWRRGRCSSRRFGSTSRRSSICSPASRATVASITSVSSSSRPTSMPWSASGDFDVVDGPGTRFGARGDGTSLYVRDPDGAVVELRYY